MLCGKLTNLCLAKFGSGHEMGSRQAVRRRVMNPDIEVTKVQTEKKEYKGIGESPSGKASGFGPDIRGFKSYLPSILETGG